MQQTEIQMATRSVGYLFAGKKAVRCILCDTLCESEKDHDASGEYDALAKHLEADHADKHEHMIAMYRNMDSR